MYKIYFGFSLVLLMFLVTVAGDTSSNAQTPKHINVKIGSEDELQKKIKGDTKPIRITVLKSVDSETRDADLFLAKRVDILDRPFIQFFTTYNIPHELREDAVLALSFVLHSLTGLSDDGNVPGYYPLAIKKNGKFVAKQRVPGSDTLWWIDIRDYNWTREALEKVALEDVYFVEPAVRHKVNSLLRLLAGNAILRADWFIVESTNAKLQEDRRSKTIIYDELLYAGVKDKPENIVEWREFWQLNKKQSEKVGNEGRVIVKDSNEVARHNRTLISYRTILGWLFETYDVQSEDGIRNYIESVTQFIRKTPIRDAGEAFVTNPLGLYVYTLINEKGDLVNDAATGVARHINDVTGDVRVRVADSCFDCHSAGPRLPINSMKEHYGSLYVPKYEDKQWIDRVFLSNVFEDMVKDAQVSYARALLKVNGLSPQENIRAYHNIVRFYFKPVSVYQMSIECGVTVETFKEKLRKHQGLPADLKSAVDKNKPVRRTIWGATSRDGIPGLFQQAMVYIYGLTEIEDIKIDRDIIVDQEDIKIERFRRY